jgi:hypothetical protein
MHLHKAQAVTVNPLKGINGPTERYSYGGREKSKRREKEIVTRLDKGQASDGIKSCNLV